MKEQFSKEEEHQSQGNPICQLLIYAEEDGNIYFTSDWGDFETAASTLGAILYRLSDGELVQEILDNLKSQCVLEDREEDYEKIFTLYSNLKLLKKSVDSASADDAVIDPIDATTL
tara:strand:- start:150 stop:497 length:348 start_codon:yes stop_codon:yes gene_type:complete